MYFWKYWVMPKVIFCQISWWKDCHSFEKASKQTSQLLSNLKLSKATRQASKSKPSNVLRAKLANEPSAVFLNQANQATHAKQAKQIKAKQVSNQAIKLCKANRVSPLIFIGSLCMRRLVEFLMFSRASLANQPSIANQNKQASKQVSKQANNQPSKQPIN